jgi:guanylate kinase
MSRGLLVIVSSPSGAGKTTLCHRLIREFPELRFSVSYTTRRPRAGEQDGVDYRFVDLVTFERMAADGMFAEWAQVHGNCYGTPSAAVAQALENGHDVLFDIDWQGGGQLRTKFPDDAVMIWVLPPSLAVLEQRLRGRATDAPAVIERRLATAKEEVQHYELYDFLVVNDELERAYLSVKSIYVAAHHTTKRQEARARRLLAELGSPGAAGGGGPGATGGGGPAIGGPPDAASGDSS